MVVGARTCVPLAGGLVVGICVTMFMFPPETFVIDLPELECKIKEEVREPIDSSEFWKVNLEKPPAVSPNQNAQPKVVRARFAATELGIRDRLLVAILAQSSLSVALNASLARHVPKVHIWAEASRVDAEMSQMANLSPYRTAGQHTHSHVLQGILNMSLHENFDWFLLVKDTTYINPFQLNRFVKNVNWNEKVLIGSPDAHGRCRLDGAVLISYPAMQTLIQNRAQCQSISAVSDQAAFEECLTLATGLKCISEHEGQPFSVWHTPSGLAAHDAVQRWAEDSDFNRSLAVTQLLSDSDAKSLHDHFVKVEMARVDAEIAALAVEVEDLFEDTSDGPTWPAAVPKYTKPPNRYQVPTWEFFTLKDIFLNEPNQNVRPLEGKDKEDVEEVVAAARTHVEQGPDGEQLEYMTMRNGYRLFDPVRGIDYMVDLVYKPREGANNPQTVQPIQKRVHLTRIIASTQLMHQVPYVKEDTDMVIVVPVKKEEEVLPARRLLARHARLCTAPVEETRKTRIVMATSEAVDQRSVTYINNDLEELKKRCKKSGLEAVQLNVKNSGSVFDGAALDEAVDHFGPQTIFLLLSPHADVQKEFFDRARINTIKKYQVFFPVPFVEYHPTISGMDVADHEVPASHEEARDAALARLRESTPPKRKRPLVVQKDHGRFDSLDFSVLAIYGSDYVQLRERLEGGNRLDVISAFLGQEEIHVLRAVEPTLRLRYHPRTCESDIDESDYARCVASKRENVASKDQLAKLLFHEA